MKMLRPVVYYHNLIYLPAMSILKINLTCAFFPHPTLVDWFLVIWSGFSFQ